MDVVWRNCCKNIKLINSNIIFKKNIKKEFHIETCRMKKLMVRGQKYLRFNLNEFLKS